MGLRGKVEVAQSTETTDVITPQEQMKAIAGVPKEEFCKYHGPEDGCESSSPEIKNEDAGEYIDDITVTSYNPEPGQTDSTPCVAGGTGVDVCDMAQRGERPIALSQEYLNWAVSAPNKDKRFNSGDRIRLEQIDGDDPRCNGVFQVVDAMNIRYRKRADLFFMSRSDNTSCKAKMYAL